jgi:hypothetical protein
MKDNSTGKTVGFYERGQAIFDRIPKMPEEKKEMKLTETEADKIIADWPRVKPAPAKPVENWYYLDEVLTLHQLGKWQGFDAAYVEMEIAATKRGTPYLILVCEDQVKDWRAQLDRWLGNDGYKNKYKKRKGDL